MNNTTDLRYVKLEKEIERLKEEVDDYKQEAESWESEYENECDEVEEAWKKYEETLEELKDLKASWPDLEAPYRERDLAVALLAKVLEVNKRSKGYRNFLTLFLSTYYSLCPEAAKYTKGTALLNSVDYRKERASMEENLIQLLETLK